MNFLPCPYYSFLGMMLIFTMSLLTPSFLSLSPFVNVVSLIDSIEILNTYIVPATVTGTNKLLMLS